jgi:hypothetical protein
LRQKTLFTTAGRILNATETMTSDTKVLKIAMSMN